MKTYQIKRYTFIFLLLCILAIIGLDIAQAVALPYWFGLLGAVGFGLRG